MPGPCAHKPSDRPGGAEDGRPPGSRGSRVCDSCLRMFESSASRLRHGKRGCSFAGQADAKPPLPFDMRGWRVCGDAVNVEPFLRRTVESMDYVGFTELVSCVLEQPLMRNVRAPPRPNAHVEVFDGEVWVRRQKSRVMSEIINRGWGLLQAFWDRSRGAMLYHAARPVCPDHEVSIDMALSSVALEDPRVHRLLKRGIGKVIVLASTP